MKSKKRAPASSPAAADELPRQTVPLGWRLVVHGWLAIHLAAMISAPLAAATMGSPLAESLFRLTRPYMDLCFLNHGYAFFAPEVGSNHLVEYRVWSDTHDEPQVARFPDRRRQWPRLLYHRHFMLSEYLNTQHAPPDMPPSMFADRSEYERWQAQRALFEQLRESFADHLQHTHDARRVELVRIEHRQPAPPEFLSGMALDDERLYRQRPDRFEPPPTGQPPGSMPTELGPPPPTSLEGAAPRFPFPYAPQESEP